MTMKPLLLALVFLPTAVLGGQEVSSAGERASRARALPSPDSVAQVALAAAVNARNDLAVTRQAEAEGRRWVSTAKWTLLAAAAGFGAYALANSRTEHADSRAQVGILGGQLSLLGSVGLFIYDLRAEHKTPENIPFEHGAQAGPPGGDGAGAPH